MFNNSGTIPQEVVDRLYEDVVQKPDAVQSLDAMWPILSEDAFHGPAGELVKLIEPNTESDPAALLVQILTMFGNMAGRGKYFEVEADRHYPNLYAVLVGKTSGGRKGTSFGRVQHGLATVDDVWTKDHQARGLSSGEGLINAVRDSRVMNGTVQDDGVSDKRLLVVESEFASVLSVKGREHSILSPVLRDAWDHGNLRTLTKKDPIRATNAHISIIGHITQEELKKLLTSTDAANGFANRFIWVCVQRSKLLPHGGTIAEDAFVPVREKFQRSLEFANVEGRIEWENQARQDWERLYYALASDKVGLFGAITSRAAAQICRLALIYSLLDRSNLIQSVHLCAATALWDYCEDSCRYLFGDVLGDPEADEILHALREAGEDGMTRTEISELFRRHLKSVQITRTLTLLGRLDLARVVLEPTAGKSAERWFIKVAKKAN